MNRRYNSLLGCGMSMLLVVSLGTAQARTSNADREFMRGAAQGGMAEVEMGKLAVHRASSDRVRRFGARMVRDHSEANSELKGLASRKGVRLPINVGPKHQPMIDRLSGLRGVEFDRTYMQHMVMDHREDISEFRKESRTGGDNDVSRWAGKTLPTLQSHLMMAGDINRSLKRREGMGQRMNGGMRRM